MGEIETQKEPRLSGRIYVSTNIKKPRLSGRIYICRVKCFSATQELHTFMPERQRETETETETETEIETGRETDRDRQTDRERERQTDRQRQRETETETETENARFITAHVETADATTGAASHSRSPI